jgi:hypothetical protein
MTSPVVTSGLADDTGISATDCITRDATLTGAADANAVVHFTVDGVAIAETATADASGVWTFAPPGLADGFHTIVASETNLSGETGTSGDLNFTLDTTAPTLTISSSPTVLRGMVEAAIFFTFSEDPGSTFDPDAGPAPLLRLGRLW